MRKASAITQPAADLAPFLERCFLFEAIESSYAITEIEGRIPKWLRGAYYVNGPARFELGKVRYNHWLDGDGMICRLRFDRRGVHFANRFIRTPKLLEEERSGRPIYRAFGTAFPNDRLRRNLMIEPPVNVSVYPFAGRLLAFGEQTLPFELDPITLETKGEFDFCGGLNEVSPFAAHPKFDVSNGHLINFGISFSSKQPSLHIYEFGADSRLLRRRRQPLRLPYSNHDFAWSAHHAAFYLSPLLMDFEKFLGQGGSVMEALRWEPSQESTILVVPRDPGAETFELAAGSGYCLHVINCFEDGHLLYLDILKLDSPVYPDYQPMPDLFQNVSRGDPVRHVIDLNSRKIVATQVIEYGLAPDFPSIDPKLTGHRYDEFCMLGISHTGRIGRKFFDQLARASWSSGRVLEMFQTAEACYLAGEPVYIGNPQNPKEGVVIVQQIDATEDRAEFLLFNARCIADGPVARLPLRHKIHPGFHASFQPLSIGENA